MFLSILGPGARDLNSQNAYVKERGCHKSVDIYR
jgi:hypothetical protein